jgi:PAS domain S-box-containing protein
MSVGEQKRVTTLDASNLSKRARFSRLLLVDDNSSLLLTLSEILEEEGFAVTKCASAAEALSHVQQHEFSIAVVDLRLPDMQGTQLLRHFRDLGSKVRVIINTGYGEFESAKDAVNSGAFAYLEKGGDPGELVREVHRANRSQFERYANDREALMSKAQSIAHLGSFEWDVSRDEITWSDEMFEIHGISREDFKGTISSVMPLIHPDDRQLVSTRIQQALKEDVDTGIEYRILRPDGSVRTVFGQAQFQGEADENSRVMVGFVQDITERKLAEEAQANLETELRHAQKMDAVGQLASGVAHEFNNLLLGILGNAELLNSTATDRLSEQDRRAIHDIGQAGARAHTLTSQLLSFGRKRITNASVFDVNRVLTDSRRLLEKPIGSNIALRIIAAAEPVCIRADKSAIEQVILNLVLNARDAITDKGTITIRTRLVTLGDSDVPQDRKPGSFVELSVSDDGCGMSRETGARILEPFFTTKEVGKGTGLGLSVVHSDVARNDGFVNVDSKEHVGTVISVLLPQTTGSIETAPVEHHKQSSGLVGGDETILICDDETLVLNAVQALLEAAGYSIIAAESAAEALVLAETHSETISLLVTDVTMPNMNGIELGQKILQRHPDMKILYLSGNTSHHAAADDNGEDLIKGGPISELLRRIRQLLDREKMSSSENASDSVQD